VVIQGVGLVSVGRTLKAAGLARDLYHRAVNVMRSAAALGGFVSLDEEESFAIEYWPLELYKLSLAPPPRELQGAVAFITGAAGGIGGAVARRLAAEGACIVVTDIDVAGATAPADEFREAGAAAYSAAKAASLHLARCLAEELGPEGIRVNTVNPDAVLEGSRIWDSAWREERARAYGIPADQLEEHYRERTTLKVNVTPADVA